MTVQLAPLTDYRINIDADIHVRGLTYIQQVPLVSPNDLLALPGKTAIITPRLCMFDIASHPTPRRFQIFSGRISHLKEI